MTGCGSPTPSRRSTCCPMPRRLRGPERMTRPHSSRRWAGPALALTLALAACTPTITGGWDESATGTGYVSGDRSVTTWDPADRTGPVEIAGTDFAGNPVDLADWRGDVVVLNTWYAACPPCRAEAPDLVALAADYAEDGVHLLGINSTDAPGAAQAFERTFEIPYPSVHGAVGVVHGRVGDLEGALEGLGGPGGVGGVDAQQVYAVLGVVGGERYQVRRLRTARRAGGIPGVQHDDVAAPVRQVDRVPGEVRPGDLHRPGAVGRIPGGDRPVAGDVPGPGRGLVPATGDGGGAGGEREGERERRARPAAGRVRSGHPLRPPQPTGHRAAGRAPARCRRSAPGHRPRSPT